jgi:hypothetical protein
MANLNESIFRDTLSLWRNNITRAMFPVAYEDLKERIVSEFGQRMLDNPQLVLRVINAVDKKAGRGEVSFQAKGEKGSCYLCGSSAHFYKSCNLYDDTLSFEDNKKKAAEIGRNTRKNIGGGTGLRPGDVSSDGESKGEGGGAGGPRLPKKKYDKGKDKKDTKGVKFEAANKCLNLEPQIGVFTESEICAKISWAE